MTARLHAPHAPSRGGDAGGPVLPAMALLPARSDGLAGHGDQRDDRDVRVASGTGGAHLRATRPRGDEARRHGRAGARPALLPSAACAASTSTGRPTATGSPGRRVGRCGPSTPTAPTSSTWPTAASAISIGRPTAARWRWRSTPAQACSPWPTATSVGCAPATFAGEHDASFSPDGTTVSTVVDRGLRRRPDRLGRVRLRRRGRRAGRPLRRHKPAQSAPEQLLGRDPQQC